MELPKTALITTKGFRDVLEIREVTPTPGGEGYGKPFEHSPELVFHDVINGLVSPESARKDYGVVIDLENMKVDWKSTKLLRLRRKH